MKKRRDNNKWENRFKRENEKYWRKDSRSNGNNKLR